MERVMFSSRIQTWETPQELFDFLNEMFKFDLDVCADEKSAKCKVYFNEEQDGLKQLWFGNCWMNPPYNRQQVHWVKKAIDEINRGNAETVVILIPARTETVAWQKYIFNEAKAICFVNGRLTFSGCNNVAPFPSAIVVFGRHLTKEEKNKHSRYGKVIGRTVEK